MTILLLSVVAPIIVSPAVLLLSQKWRRILLQTYIVGLLFLAFYLLSGIELGNYTLFADSAHHLKTNLTFFSFSEHSYSKIAAFGFLFVGAMGLLFGLDVSKPSEQALSLGAIAAAIGVCFADNFLTFLFFWEILTLTTAALVFLKRTPHAVRMAYRMLFFSLASGFSLLVGIILQYNAVGTFELMYPVAGLSFFILGIGIKTAFLPLYFWLPWGYAAASFPSSVLLAVLCTKVGVYAVARILPPSNFIVMMGACMAIFAVVMALLQNNLRRFLSYHIISQVGYMVAAVGLGVSFSIDGGFLHLLNHMFYKALLFMSVGALIFTARTENFQKLSSTENSIVEAGKRSPLWKALPAAFVGALVGSLAISGTPLFNGYVGKYLIKNAMSGVQPAEILLMITSVGTVLCFCKFIYFGFIKARAKIRKRLTSSMQTAIVILSASCLITGIRPQLLASILPYSSSLEVYTMEGIVMAMLILASGVVMFALLHRVLEKEIKLSFPATIKSALNILPGIYSSLSNVTGAVSSRFHYLYFGCRQKLNTKVNKIKTSQFAYATSIDFDTLLLMGMLGIVLTLFFCLQFGLFRIIIS
mgnify:FL=1